MSGIAKIVLGNMQFEEEFPGQKEENEQYIYIKQPEYLLIQGLSSYTLEKHIVPFVRSLRYIENSLSGALFEDHFGEGFTVYRIDVLSKDLIEIYVWEMDSRNTLDLLEKVLIPWRDENWSDLQNLSIQFSRTLIAGSMAAGASSRVQVIGDSYLTSELKASIASLKQTEERSKSEYGRLCDTLKTKLQNHIQVTLDTFAKIFEQDGFLENCAQVALSPFDFAVVQDVQMSEEKTQAGEDSPGY